MKRLLIMLAAVLSLGTIGLPAAAQAATAPPNDSFAHATVITSLPYSTTEDTSQATWASSDPTGCTNSGSVWFRFTPSSDMQIATNTAGSDYDATVSVWTGTSRSLSMVACSLPYGQGRTVFSATAGTTYYLLVGSCCGDGGNGGGNLQLSVHQVFPPANDSFADATPIGALPYEDTQDLTAATVEPGEQQPGCFYPGTNNTEWYSFTAPATESITAATNQFNVGAAVYTGGSLTSLSQVACFASEGHVTFRAQAGTTYYFQVAVSSTINLRPVTFHLSVAPNPDARFYFTPGDPNTYDTIQFYDASSDPADVGFSAHTWDFGDGSTSTDSNPAHRYATDGDYTVRLTVTTSDGRTDSVTQVVHVQTHDVAIARLAVPDSARVGETIAVNVFVEDTRYPENVEVDLFKSIPGGFSQAGSLTQPVAAGRAGQTTRFTVKCTVTSDDKAAGKVTFRADATIVDHRDARPVDDELLSTPVTVN